MSISPHCDFCKKELRQPGAILFGPPKKNGEVRKFHLCQKCYKQLVKLMRFSIDEIEDVLTLGPSWLNYTRRVKRKTK